uniref:Uncharacterized protein n=1 Tax=Rhizochromulina marina TaxID=1034831 RepID=A0A7S2SPW6_9STRA|mmetsp:Transcript_33321/g.96553  ORF Transcript_33321/g.96553 Transcript_33321/m.96553 type:complete len:168 (+) Transcript_33321:193-696(+)
MKRVSVGRAGFTPKKGILFHGSDPPDRVQHAEQMPSNGSLEGDLDDLAFQIFTNVAEAQRDAAGAALAAEQTAAALQQEHEEKPPQFEMAGPSSERPSTSRRIPNPSPDRFHDYVIPSPTKEPAPGTSVVWQVDAAVSEQGKSRQQSTGEFGRWLLSTAFSCTAVEC